MTLAPTPITRLTCEKCHTVDGMRPATVRAYPGAVVALGFVLWVPAAVIIGFSLLGVLVGGFSEEMVNSPAAVEIGAMAAFGVVALIVSALPFLALGMFLTRTRKLWKSQACAYVYDRA
jgi:hypothetical protein